MMAEEIDLKDGSRPWWGKIEGNPSRSLDPDGYSLCPPEAVREVVAPVWDAASGSLFGPDCEADDARVKRLDTARDFEGVMDTPALLVGLAGVYRPHSKRNDVYNDGKANGAQTLVVGHKSGSARLYNKHEETAGLAPVGALRWEAQARSGWCARAGIERLRDVGKMSAVELAEERWRWSGMDAEVCTRNEVVARVMAAGLTPAMERTLLGWMMQKASGFESSMSNDAASKYRKLARDLGVTLGPETFAGSMVGHLDWEAGTVVLRAA